MKKILFLTGTRADYGKMKPLMCAVEESKEFECHIFVTGMHTLQEFGNTQFEIIQDHFTNIHIYMNQIIEEPMDLVLANTINGFSRYIRELRPDMIVIHGDRVEALAGAICGALNNILVAHIEGGELSGTIDESIRHSISKLAHVHFVSNEDAKRRLIQMGEQENTIFVIGSPDIDLIMNKSSLDYKQIMERYEIPFSDYAILMYHPVTTELHYLRENVHSLVDAVLESNLNYIVINPNNDNGYHIILEEYQRLNGCERIKRYPSIRFEFFIELMRHAQLLLGNSSAGIHEAPVIGLSSVNIGSRQKNRFQYDTIINVKEGKTDILEGIKVAKALDKQKSTTYFGNGNSKQLFFEAIQGTQIWEIARQKIFVDINI